MDKIVQDAQGQIIQQLTLFRSNRNINELTMQASSIHP
jgi:hypothetical protein